MSDGAFWAAAVTGCCGPTGPVRIALRGGVGLQRPILETIAAVVVIAVMTVITGDPTPQQK